MQLSELDINKHFIMLVSNVVCRHSNVEIFSNYL